MTFKPWLPAAAALLLLACNSTPKADTAEVKDAQQPAAAAGAGTTYRVDGANSRLMWVGSNPKDNHTGLIPIENGSIQVAGGQPVAGTLTMQVTALEVTDLKEDEGKAKLEGHLKSPDFFDVAQYPSAKFEITAVQPYDSTNTEGRYAGATHTVSGNLTLKGQTQNVTFPARVAMSGNGLTADAKFTIDRSRWGLNYKGQNNPQNWIIAKEVELEMNVKANKE